MLLFALAILAGFALGTVILDAHQMTFSLIVVTIGAVLALLLCARATHSITRRMRRALEISQAWLRGNLSLRIAETSTDDLGRLTRQLDQLVERLEQDEQDLHELRERNVRLADQVRALAVVEERNRLARELHDSVKQHLFSLTMTAGAIRTHFDMLQGVPDELADMVNEIEKAARTAQRETTRLIENLRPGSLQEQGLAAALNDYALLVGAREHLLVYLDVQGDDAHLPPSVAEALYRVVQEALHNVTRHARATRADIQLLLIPGQVELTIRDNGAGFDVNNSRRGLGLANMQERIMTVGGRLTVTSQPGAGTTVLAQVALPHVPVTEAESAAQDQQRPRPTVQNWAWLGRKLVIPVGQTWPWLPADQLHLRRPSVAPPPDEEPLIFKKATGLLGLRRVYILQTAQREKPLVRVHQGRLGYEWEAEGASWSLRHMRRLSGRMVLTRNGQPLAAIQYRGRKLDTWSEIVYDGRGYRLSYCKDHPGLCILADEAGQELLVAQGGASLQIGLRQALPLPLLVLVAVRLLDEISTSNAVSTTVMEYGNYTQERSKP